MRMYDIIKKKRDGYALSEEEIAAFVRGYTDGDIPDYQAAALLMAIYFSGMNREETAALTFAIRDSGEKLPTDGIAGIRADKHSTGGVGDKTSLVVMPIVAALGVKVAKMSGRGLGHTGGTVDKLEAIPGFRTDLSDREFAEVVNRVGLSIVGQSRTLAPADKKLYALRDVTATVDSMPLIASSIMGKKLAADDDCIVLDVKTGSGSFMKTDEDSRTLARMMVDIGRAAGKRISAVITDMETPLGYTVGNALEVREAVETLQGQGRDDLTELSLTLAAEILMLTGEYGQTSARSEAERVLRDGSAFRKLCETVEAQGGDVRALHDLPLLPQAAYTETVTAAAGGYITSTDAEAYGRAALLLGAGRNKKDDTIQPAAGLVLLRKRGDAVEKGEPIAVMHTDNPALLGAARDTLLAAVTIGTAPPVKRELIRGFVR